MGIAAIYSLARPASAVSSEAGLVRASAGAIVERVESSDALFGARSRLISELRALAASHREHGWDGGQALPAAASAITRAVDFVRFLPDSWEMPEVGVDPDGAVSVDWIASRHRMLSVSFAGESDRLAYAWIDGTDRGHAVERFDGSRAPKRLMNAIAAIAEAINRVALRPA